MLNALKVKGIAHIVHYLLLRCTMYHWLLWHKTMMPS